MREFRFEHDILNLWPDDLVTNFPTHLRGLYERVLATMGESAAHYYISETAHDVNNRLVRNYQALKIVKGTNINVRKLWMDTIKNDPALDAAFEAAYRV